MRVILLTLLTKLRAEWNVGRISEGQYEYDKLNGWMTPRTAESLCENDGQCGGFTYKGSELMERCNKKN